MRRLLLVAFLTFIAMPLLADASIHILEFENHAAGPQPEPVIWPDVPPRAAKDAGTPYLLGFYPYWGGSLSDVPFSLLDEVSYHGADVSSDGSLTNMHGWPRHDLVAAAHLQGCRVSLSLVLFSPDEQRTLLSSSIYRANLVENTVQAVIDGNADGVNVDFEALPSDMKNRFVSLINELADALAATFGEVVLSVDTPAVDWSGSYDYDQLAANALLLVMGYDYHYRGGDPGPVAPLLGSTLWGQYAWDWTLQDYVTYMAPYTLKRVVMGMPFYGYDWPSAGPGIPGTATGTASARAIAAAWDLAASYGGGSWDSASLTPYLAYFEGQWRQLWYEDLDSIAEKLAYLQDLDVGGAGFWALTYDDGDADLWQLIEDYKYGGIDDDVADDDTVDDDAVDDDAVDDDDDSGGCGYCGPLWFL